MHQFRKLSSTNRRGILVFLGLFSIVVLIATEKMSMALREAYQGEISQQILDRNGKLLQLSPNSRGHYMTPSESTPRVRELTVLKEDRYFYYHLGVNPFSVFRGILHSLMYGERSGASTITQQLVKNLLHHENERTLNNKLSELFYAIALELHTSKEDILTMYLNSAYFGNQIEGIEGASQYYFGKSAALLEDGEILRLLALLSAPAFGPESAGNTLRATNLGRRLGVEEIPEYQNIPRSVRETKKDPAMFELRSLSSFSECDTPCALWIDRELTAKIREIVHGALNTKPFASVTNAAVVVIKLGEGAEPNKLLALVGSPNPYGSEDGSQINMATSPRPIGSTWKPFIYGQAIEKGVRPYSLIDDTEYRREIGTGYGFYPKNYDGIYRGDVTLHYALANSLNVPAVRALEWVGIDDFGKFMRDLLGFIPRQPLDSYQLSIALGGLEMNPLLLANYFTVFPRNGTLFPLLLAPGKPATIPMMMPIREPRQVFHATTTELVNKMLADRLLGVEQFGLESNLNLPFKDYAVKTGTSYDYHDSWTVGYTSDAVVAVWIGNSDNKAMDLVTGARGAGKIWHDVMTLLAAQGEVVPRAFAEASIVAVATEEGRSFGLINDNIDQARRIMKNENELVLEPHDKDVILFQPNMEVPLRAKRSVVWKIDGKILGEGEKLFWSPTKAKEYVIEVYEKETLLTKLRVRVVP